MSQYDYTFKIMILGDDHAGKTAMTKRYCYNIFNPSERLTIGVDFHVKTVELNDSIIKLQMWDVGGEERFRFLLPTYCSGANAAFLLYDITRPSTLDNISEWTRIVRSRGDDIPIILIGSILSSEDSRVVSRQKGISTAEDNNLSAFVEICPETGQNVDDVFNVLLSLLFEDGELNTPLTIQPELTPIKIKPKFKINTYLELRLENKKSNIYVGGRLFNQCKYLLLDLSSTNKNNYDKIESIDEAAEKLDNSMERGSIKYSISPETEFWGHCSNLQAWYENDYDTRILHRNLAFPLLRALVEVGDPLAKNVFKEQIAIRFESGYPSVILHLIDQGYLKYLTKDELNTILENPDFIRNLPKWFKHFKDVPKWLLKNIEANLKDLNCSYCGIKIKKAIIQRFLEGKSNKCEYCYSNLI